MIPAPAAKADDGDPQITVGPDHARLADGGPRRRGGQRGVARREFFRKVRRFINGWRVDGCGGKIIGPPGGRGRVFGVTRGDLRLLFVAFMEIKPITESDTLPGGHDQIAGGLIRQFFKIMPAKRIGGEQAIIPHMPPSGMAGIRRMIKMATPTK
jgi:hypothetical protein